jgi:hypothetical protein
VIYALNKHCAVAHCAVAHCAVARAHVQARRGRIFDLCVGVHTARRHFKINVWMCVDVCGCVWMCVCVCARAQIK